MVHAFEDSRQAYKSYTSSTTTPDFSLAFAGAKRITYVEVKEKRQKYNRHSYNLHNQNGKFILDDLTVRKLFILGPEACLFIRDTSNGGKNYYFLSAADLMMIPKRRFNREVSVRSPSVDFSLKGKWMIDLRDARSFIEPEFLISEAEAYTHEVGDVSHDASFYVSPCYGDYRTENIPIYGTRRKLDWQSKDYNETR